VLSFFSSRRNWDCPQPRTRTRWRERGWERPNSDEGTYGGLIKGILRGVRCTKSLRVLFLHRRPPSWSTLVLYSRAVFIFNEPAYTLWYSLYCIYVLCASTYIPCNYIMFIYPMTTSPCSTSLIVSPWCSGLNYLGRRWSAAVSLALSGIFMLATIPFLGIPVPRKEKNSCNFSDILLPTFPAP
jgi:hypothetical protein